MATQSELNVIFAAWDDSGWVLSNESTEHISEWPSDWPDTVTANFLRRRGIEVVIIF